MSGVAQKLILHLFVFTIFVNGWEDGIECTFINLVDDTKL